VRFDTFLLFRYESRTAANNFSLCAYTEDVQGFYDNMNLKVNADKPDWSTFADIFKGAKIYE
jgi:hypothetical protein